MYRLEKSLAAVAMLAAALSAPAQIENPILPGFNPDPTICRVDSDYYICTSSFTWYPGLPIYRSRDLRHWEKVANAIDRPGMVTLDGVRDKDGVWAPTLRHHGGKWYLFCNVSNGGNFYITANDVRGPWSDPVFIKGAPGIDPDIFWDDDGRSYLLANTGKFPGRKHPASTAIWIQEIDLATGQLLGERSYIATGHAFNAKYAEGAHLYKIDGRYVLTVAEGGTDFNHAVTLFTSRNLMGPYIPQQVNPVLSQRQFGHGSPLQCVGHADMVQTGPGQWYAVALGKRMVDGRHSFTRETFICPVAIQDGEFIFNPGRGGMTMEVEAPALPESPVALPPDSDSFDGPELLGYWHFNRIPHTRFHAFDGGSLLLTPQPETIDSLVCPAMLMRRVRSHRYTAQTLMGFRPRREGERAGLVLHRNSTAYVALLRTVGGLAVVESGRVTKTVPYGASDVVMRLRADGMEAVLEYGPTETDMREAARVSLVGLADDGKLNRFNGLGVGVYATTSGKKARGQARFDYFAYADN